MTISRLPVVLLFGLIFSLAVSAGAQSGTDQLLQSIKADFSAVGGYIVMSLDGAYLIDIGADRGARAGDILSVIRQGDRIIHPVSGEDLGAIEKRVALLRITKVEPKYSQAVVISGERELAKGTPLKRFAGLKAEFAGEGPSAETLYLELRSTLPRLDWRKVGTLPRVAQSSPVDLRFAFKGARLDVTGPDSTLLHRYSVTEPAESSGEKASAAALVHYEAADSAVSLVGTLQGKTLMADFVQGPAGLLLATTDGTFVRVYSVEEHPHLIAEISFNDRDIDALSWWQPRSDGLYLVISGSTEKLPTLGTGSETVPLSEVLELQGDQLQPRYANLSYFLGTFDVDGDSRKERLLGQSLDLDNFFGRVVELSPAGKRLKATSPGLEFPPSFPVQGSLIADLDGDRKPETVVLKDGILTIYQGRRKIHQTRREFGGSLSQLTYDRNPGQQATMFSTATFEINPVVADIDNDGRDELVAVSSHRPTFNAAFDGKPDISEVGLALLKPRDGDYARGDLKVKSDSPIQGLYADRHRILFVSAGNSDAKFTGPVSQLMVIPLRKKD